MAITGFNESTLSQSKVWKTLNEMNPKETMQQRAIALIKKDGRVLTGEDIEAAYVAVKQISDTLTVASLKAFNAQRVQVIYNENPKKSINQAIPFLTFKSGGQYTTYVFAGNKYVTNKNGTLSIQAPIFRDLIIGGTVANGIRTNYSKMTANTYLQETLMKIYCAFVSRILNREYSIMTDKLAFDKIQYWINRFFLHNVFGSTDISENIEKMSRMPIKYLDTIGIDDAKNTYDNANPDNFEALLEFIRSQIGRMKSLNLGTFLSDWISYYHQQSLLAVDNIEYLVFMILCLLSGNNIINISASDIVKETKKINMLRGELLKLIPDIHQ